MQVLVGTSDGPLYEGGNLRVRVAVLSDDGQPWDVAPTSVVLSVLDEDGAALAGGGAMTREDDDAGQATSGSTTGLADTQQAWRVEHWRGAIVQLVAGTGSGQVRRVEHSDDDSLTIDPMLNGAYVGPWVTTPDNTSQYRLHRSHWVSDYEVPAGTEGTTITAQVDVENPAGGTVTRRVSIRIEANP